MIRVWKADPIRGEETFVSELSCNSGLKSGVNCVDVSSGVKRQLLCQSVLDLSSTIFPKA